MTAIDGGTTGGLPPDGWERFVAMLPVGAQSVAKSTRNTAALAQAARRGWNAAVLLAFVTQGIDGASNPAAHVSSRLVIAASREPAKPAARAEVVSPPRPRAPATGACAGNGRDTTGCGQLTTVRTSNGRHCCPEHL